MAKGRRSGGSANPSPSRSDAKLNRWETDDDIPDDAEDSFHRNRDKILLGGKRGGDDDDEDDADARGNWSSGREVLGVDVEEEEDHDDEEGEQDYMEEDEGEEEYVGRRKAARAKREVKAAMRPGAAKGATAQDDSDSDVEVDPSAAAEDEDEHTGWGPHKKAYYNTNDLDDMSSDSELDEDERRELEIKEVRKLQSRSRAEMVDEDFGLGDAVDAVSEAKERQKRKAELDGVSSAPAAPFAPQVVKLPSSEADKAALLAQVQKSTPETIALAGDFADVVAQLADVDAALKRAIKETPDHPSVALFHLHHQTLLTYISSLVFYFHLRVQPEYVAAPATLNSHPIMGRLLKLKQGLASLEDLGFAAGAQDEEEGSEEEDEEGSDEIDSSEEQELGSIFEPSPFDGDSVGSLESDELAELAAEEAEQKKRAKKGAKKVAVKAKEEAKKKQAKKRGDTVAVEPKTAAPLASLADLADETVTASNEASKAKRKRAAATALGDMEAAEAFGEPSALSAADSSDKAARRRSLKFHTGQIAAKEARRGQAGRNNLGGDADIPYRDRERSRMAVAQASANKAAKAAALENGPSLMDEGLDDLDFGAEDLADWKDVMGGGAGGLGGFGEDGAEEQDADDGYYDLVSKRRKKERDEKREAYEAEQDETRFIDDANLAPGEHRAITRQIEKNKGLSQRRPKANRNPRVKKRLKFEKAQKKLSSMGPVYKGGLAALEGGYQGEKSGISSHVVKSRRFGG